MPQVSPDAYASYDRNSTAVVSQFVKQLKGNVLTAPQTSNRAVFDSAAEAGFMADLEKLDDERRTGGRALATPPTLRAIYDEMGSDAERAQINAAILDGIVIYERMHGTEVPADVVEHALSMGYATTQEAQRKYHLDSATSTSSDPLSLQPNRAVVAIMSSIAEAFPVAHYLPADIGSNEAVLAILTHTAGTAHGAYAQNAQMDAQLSGQSYISASRIHTSFPAVTTGAVTGKITAKQSTADTCNAAAGDLKLIRGRSLICVQGRPVGREVDASGSGNSTVSGTATLEGVDYVIAGVINTDTGAYALTTTPPMPVTVPVAVEGFIDFEKAKDLIPSIDTNVNTYKLHAAPWHVYAQTGVGSRTQMANELGLDPASESMYAIQVQYANERHRQILDKARRLAGNHHETYDFDWPDRSAQMNRAQCWRDFLSKLSAVSQKMVLDTMDHGVTHLYVGNLLQADFCNLPSDMFVPSGIAPRPGIYRLGRLAGLYDVYYTPTGINESENGSASQVLCLGRGTSVARNPFVLGDAVPPMMEPIAGDKSMTKGAAFYARGFTSVNPHPQSQLGAALIDVTNLK